jgi:hypothetical protein
MACINPVRVQARAQKVAEPGREARVALPARSSHNAMFIDQLDPLNRALPHACSATDQHTAMTDKERTITSVAR